MFVSQPTLTYQIKLLEEEVGFPIFERSGKGAALTPAGAQFVSFLAGMREELKRAVEQGQNFSATYRDSISIGLMVRQAVYFLPEAIRLFAETNGDVQITPVFRYENGVESFLRNETDILFALREQTKQIPGIAVHELFESRVYLIADRGDPLAGKDVIREEDLYGRTLMVGGGSPPALKAVQSRFLMRYKESYDREPKRRKTTKEYEKASRRYKKARKALELAEESTPEMVAEFKAARKGKMSQHYHDPFEQGYKKIQYNRYADDFVIGVIGSKKDAMEIKENVKVFLRDVLHLEMSDEKTKVTHSSKKVRYLGYDFRVDHSKNVKRCEAGDLKRVWYGKVFLYVPKEKWIKKVMENEAVQVKRDPVSGKETWRPMPRKELMNRNDADIVSTFNSEIYGLYNFYRIAENVGVLHKYYYMVRYSMLKTLAGKHRTYVSAIKKRYMRNGVLRIPYQAQKGLKCCEFYHGGFKKHSDGYDNVSDILPVYKKYDRRFTIINRIKAGLCEICGASAEYVCMHHVRSLKALNGTDIFERKMLEIRRKSLALCPDCWNELQLVLISG
jgi:hypothetical protein